MIEFVTMVFEISDPEQLEKLEFARATNGVDEPTCVDGEEEQFN